MKRALAAGYTALAVTVDTPVLGRREADMRNRFKLPEHLTMGNFVSAGGEHAEGTKDGGNDSVRFVDFFSRCSFVRLFDVPASFLFAILFFRVFDFFDCPRIFSIVKLFDFGERGGQGLQSGSDPNMGSDVI